MYNYHAYFICLKEKKIVFSAFGSSEWQLQPYSNVNQLSTVLIVQYSGQLAPVNNNYLVVLEAGEKLCIEKSHVF